MMDAALLEEPPILCEVFADCIRLSHRRKGAADDEVYIHRLDTTDDSCGNGRPPLQLSSAQPDARSEAPRRCLASFACWGTFGVALEPSGGYLLLVETAERVGQIGEGQIFGIRSFRALDLRKPTEQQQQQLEKAFCTRQLKRPLRLRPGDVLAAEVLVTDFAGSWLSSSWSKECTSSASVGCEESSPYLPWIFEALAMGGFFFSPTFDLSVSLHHVLKQKLADLGPAAAEPRKGTADTVGGNRFLWNRTLLQPLQQHAATLGVRAIQGRSTSLIHLVLISRKDATRLGTRFHSRGLNVKGDASNFVETEQLLLHYSHDCLPSCCAFPQQRGCDTGSCGSADKRTWRLEVQSFLQLRGSVPLLWQQPPTLSWCPPPHLDGALSDSAAAAKRHFDALKMCYGDIEAVNLVDKKGWQRSLGEKMEAVILPLQDVHYTWFDFHAECRNMQWENVYRRQKGVIRTNCVDCLDRSNVVQSIFARAVLHKQLSIVTPTPSLAAAPDKAAAKAAATETEDAFAPLTVSASAENSFRTLWTANADALSILYSGTPALKTDFTRTGKRCLWGALMDAKNSCCRYFLNNFSDGFKEDCLLFCSSPFIRLPLRPPRAPGGLRRVAAEYLLLLLLCLSVTPFFKAAGLLHAAGARVTRLVLMGPEFLLRSGLLLPALFQSLPLIGWLTCNPGSLLEPLTGVHNPKMALQEGSTNAVIDALAFLGGCLLLLVALILGGAAYVRLRRDACISSPVLQQQTISN
ncbi:sac1 phosphoinositide [Cyclospora cayetanensis]|uniref:Sac1 phosphoinositide n=1 Tax=Cyclospora cayetanensis TaxID=88456 RepID=A0A1D3CVT9_9EIME|nr:sac1 phosphoinositide [Cyclospora cayetanensis]